jgi:uncharacterized membrane protein|tara:strand:- start:1487 stop:1849 length:363 start_codon:yes stop_codon:yes gene_type:complete
MHDLLAIPDFLKRYKKRGRPRKIHQPNYLEDTRKKYEEWDLIKQKKYGKPYRIHFNNEVPRIGSGIRKVYVKEGRKWAHLSYHPGDPIETFVTRSRIRMSQWNKLKQSHEKYKKIFEEDT